MKNTHSNKLNPLSYWFINHVRALLFGLGAIWRTPFATLMTLLVIGITLSLPSGLYVVLKNFQNISRHWHDSPSISLYLKSTVNKNAALKLIETLKQNKAIEKINYISPAKGLEQFQKAAQFGDVLSQLNTNPLPAVIVIVPKSEYQSPQKLQSLLAILKALPEVDIGQLDLTWIKRLFSIISIAKRITYAMAFIFALGVIVIIGNTIRLTTQSHRQEINVLKLVGATHGFIRRPLLYRGILYGFLGSGIACLLLSALLAWLHQPAQLLAESYNNSFHLYSLNARMAISLLAIGSLLGWLGSWLAVARHLHADEAISDPTAPL